ncbi:Mitotic-spindle organizing protein 1 [Sorochytrium milnesiophthora]
MEDAKTADARASMDALLEISNLLNTGLDRETLSICISLCEAGVNPDALAAVIKELRRERMASQLASDTTAASDKTR